MALFTIGVILVLLLAAEIVVRVRQHLRYGSTATLEEQYTVDPRLNLRVPVAGFSRGRIEVNAMGFRGPDIEVPKPANTLRLAFLGASTTWCAEVSSNDLVWPHLVATELSRAFRTTRFDYVNAGVPGYTLESMQRSLELRVASLEPDVIVIYEATNDLSGEMRRVAAARGVIESDRFEVESWPGRYSLLWYLAEKNLRVLAAQRIAKSAGMRLEFDPREIGHEYRADLTRLVRTAQRHAKLVAVATFSVQPRRGQTEERQMQASSSALFYMPFLHPESIIAAYERYNDIVREVARQTGSLLIEGENDIPGDPVHFADTVHFTDAGSRAMAARISSALMADTRLKALLPN